MKLFHLNGIFRSKFQLVCSVFPKDTLQDFFVPALRFGIHFHELFLLRQGEGIAVRLIAVHNENSSAFPRFCIDRVAV